MAFLIFQNFPIHLLKSYYFLNLVINIQDSAILQMVWEYSFIEYSYRAIVDTGLKTYVCCEAWNCDKEQTADLSIITKALLYHNHLVI